MKAVFVGMGFVLVGLIIYSQIPYPERKNKYYTSLKKSY